MHYIVMDSVFRNDAYLNFKHLDVDYIVKTTFRKERKDFLKQVNLYLVRIRYVFAFR